MAEDSCFPFGSMYVPSARATDVPMSDWEADLQRMKKLGFTILRSWVAWDRIEPEEGRRNFEMLDRIFDLAARYGLKITLNVGGSASNLVGCYAPPWLMTKYHCTQRRASLNEAPAASLPGGICFDDPVFREKTKEFLTEVIRRYAQKEALHSWIIWNESGWAGCFCPHTLENFRRWLKAKYSDLTALNACWSSEATIRFESWEEVAPVSCGYAAQIDWLTFCEENLHAALAFIQGLVKQHDPQQRPTTTNPCPYDLDARSAYNRNNFWQTGKLVDVLGISHYAFQYPYQGKEPYVTACYLDRVRSASRQPYFWVVETTAGPILWNFEGLAPYAMAPQKSVLQYWQMLGHGAQVILSWMYRSRISDRQAGEFGLVGWDGSLTDRALAAGEFGRFLQAHADVFLSRECRADIAILCAQSTLRLAWVEGYEGPEYREPHGKSYWQRSWMGAYRLLWDAHIPADFMDDDDAVGGKLKKYKVLLVPFRPNIEGRVADALKEFIRGGGLVIAEFPLGFKNDRGLLYPASPGAGLSDVFGYTSTDAVPAQDTKISVPAGPGMPAVSFKPYLFQQSLGAKPAASIVGTFGSSAPAIVMNAHGRGRAYMIGTMAFALYEETRDAAVRTLITSWLGSAEILPDVELAATKDSKALCNRIEICRLTRPDDPPGKGAPLYVVLNHGEKKARVRLKFRHKAARLSVKELKRNVPVKLAARGGLLHGELTIDANDAALLLVSADEA